LALTWWSAIWDCERELEAGNYFPIWMRAQPDEIAPPAAVPRDEILHEEKKNNRVGVEHSHISFVFVNHKRKSKKND
jgi:hypothetical protein